MQMIVRMFVAALVFYVVIILALPLFLTAIAFPLPPAVMGLLKLAAILVAIWYVIWGRPVPMP